ncbi:MAG: AMP-binding protein [Bacteroidales bacterium]|nr:AMP-binding protein [Bacteroidales bacterium]
MNRLIELTQDDPEYIQFVEGDRNTTRRQFLEKAGKVAACIRQSGLPHSSFIPIVLPNGSDYLAAETGIWMSGNASVHLGMTFPKERIDYIVNECEAPLIIDEQYMEKAEGFEPDYTLSERAPEQDCAMFYTSGSTGNPKGVLHSDRGFMEGIRRAFNSKCHKHEVFGSVAPFYFIAVICVHQSIYFANSTVDIIDTKTFLNFNAFKNHIKTHHITLTFMSPSMLKACEVSEFGLHIIWTGSERVSNVAPKGGECLLCNGYGQTELVGNVLNFEMDKPYDNTPVGKAFPGVEVFVVDENDNILPDGQEGELCVRGITPCKYFKDPEKTAHAMRSGFYHTGDILKCLPSGDYVFVNRKDWMVKINGQRVEPGEVETVMRGIEGVTGAVVKGFDGRGSQYLCAYYTGDGNVDGDVIREKLSAKLPPYMIPVYYVKMDKFPLNANGKLDRKSLKSPEAATLKEDFVAPANEVESILCDSFARALKEDRIGVNDDFFLMGGTSIQMMEIQQRCAASGNAAFTAMSTKLINKGRTPRGIANLLSREKVHEKEHLDDYPLSSVQVSYYKICASHPDLPLFNVSNLIKLDSGVDTERLVSAIAAAVAAHPGLHTRFFVNEAGEPRQKYVPQKVELEVERISDRDFETLKMQLIQPFNLLKDILFRFRIFRTDSASYLFYDIHHIVFDGTSLAILFRDIEKAYQGQVIESEDWNSFEMTAEEMHLVGPEAIEKAKGWFRDSYEGAAAPKRPDTDSGASPKLTERFFCLDVSYDDLTRFCNDNGITVNILTTSAFALLLGRYGCRNDVLFTSAYNGREDIRVRNTVGLFARTIYLRSRWKEDGQVRDFLNDMRGIILDSMDYSLFYNGLLRNYIHELPGYHFIYQGEITGEPVIGGKSTETVRISEKQAISAIECNLFLNSRLRTFSLQLLYKKDYFSADFIGRFSDNYNSVLKGLMTKASLIEIDAAISDQDKF